ncbi:LemA family protein [Pseudahrensia aquimaris]|uniref:LemA family protein n=1 Tax=Pseudahrensia aquimaris TaxID=744461 RepID=A0ABW3FHN0_9HYPH
MAHSVTQPSYDQPVKRSLRMAVIVLAGLVLASCGVNNIPTFEEKARAAWSQVQNQYKRRADLIPNLVETVKGFAAQEREVLTAVVEARSKASSVQITPDMLTNPDAMRAFEQNQAALSGALSRLLVTVERYPELKSSQNFLTLQSQLEGTENRISVARRDYIEAVRIYNTELKTIPGRWWRSLMYPENQEMASFTISEEDAKNPEVKFN